LFHHARICLFNRQGNCRSTIRRLRQS
jgi:hypothetical protein